MIQIQLSGALLLGTRIGRERDIGREGRCVVSVLSAVVGIVCCSHGEMKR